VAYKTKEDVSTPMSSFNFDTPQAESGRNYTTYDAILQPQVLLPSQFSDSRHRPAQLEPLRRLMAAILEDALRCFQRNINARGIRLRREFLEAKEWFFGSGAEGPFAFENVCSVLDLDPKQLRRNLRDWRTNQSARATRTNQVAS